MHLLLSMIASLLERQGDHGRADNGTNGQACIQINKQTDKLGGTKTTVDRQIGMTQKLIYHMTACWNIKSSYCIRNILLQALSRLHQLDVLGTCLVVEHARMTHIKLKTQEQARQ